jgi:hypothetical protein
MRQLNGKFTPINTRQRLYLDAITSGKSKREAKQIAGYSQSTSTSDIESPSLKVLFARLVRHKIPGHVLAQRIAEGLNAKETKFFQHEGKVTDSREVIAWSERRQYAELAARYGSYVEPEKGSDVNVGVGLTLYNGVTNPKRGENE